jgi:hypothetical protein
VKTRRSNWRKLSICTAMSTTNSIWIGPGSKPGIREGNLATNILSTACYLVTVTTVPKVPAVTFAAL